MTETEWALAMLTKSGIATNHFGRKINRILLTNDSSEAYSDGNVTDFIVYNDTQWVGYMTNDTKTKRATWYEGYNFGGTAEWAVDLEEFVINDESSSSGSSGSSGSSDTATLTVDPEIWQQPSPAVTCAPPRLMTMPPPTFDLQHHNYLPP
ncbi:glycoside hydrolase [Penicillium nucicola]|uniref:glycoside hydrolase n=1 Tax=Penicillium nucicola TaxID=1850975 RepID=UPI00254550EE|nr:glycoside hydrolase [Penicillium nucicola]KAJ5742613.1 glycoside hydrolase [Penicillium nucicola]